MCFQMPRPNQSFSTAQLERPSPEMNANFPSRVMFSWFTGFMLKGWKNPLTTEDLYNLKPTDSAKAINDSWDKNWNAELEGAQKSTKEGKGSIFMPLVKTFGGMFLTASVIRLVNILIQVVRGDCKAVVLFWLLISNFFSVCAQCSELHNSLREQWRGAMERLPLHFGLNTIEFCKDGDGLSVFLWCEHGRFEGENCPDLRHILKGIKTMSQL